MAEGEVLVVVEILEIRDAAAFDEYQQGARAQFGGFGGSVLARGGAMHEGSDAFGPLLIQRWPSEAAFRAWQESEAYQPLLEKRRQAADMRMSIIPVS
jgi:uncharacterized protein (DUF1330 family)